MLLDDKIQLKIMLSIEFLKLVFYFLFQIILQTKWYSTIYKRKPLSKKKCF